MAGFPEIGACDGEIIDAHSISRQHLLEIADETGHFSTFFSALRKPAMEEFTFGGEFPQPQRAGVNNFGTFPGLCRRHDNDLFAPFEKCVFQGTYEQVFGLHIRAILRELWTKDRNNYGLDYLQSHTGETFEQRTAAEKSDRINRFLKNAELGITDLQHVLRNSVGLRPNGSGQRLKYLHFRMSDQFPILCATSANPPFDLRGERIQDYANTDIPLYDICVSYLKDAGGPHCVLSWVDSEPIGKLMKSFCERYSGNIASGLTQLAFLYAENVAFRTSWFEDLGVIKQSRLAKIYWSLSATRAFSQNGGVDQLRSLDFNVGTVQSMSFMGEPLLDLASATF